MANSEGQRVSRIYIRTMADYLAKAYHFARLCNKLAIANNWQTLIPNDPTPLDDGQSPPVTQDQLNIVLAHAATYAADLEANGAVKLNQILAVAPNPEV